MVLGNNLDGNKNSNSTKFRGEFTMCSNPYNLIVFPNSLAFPFLHRQQFQEMGLYEDQHKLHHEEAIGYESDSPRCSIADESSWSTLPS